MGLKRRFVRWYMGRVAGRHCPCEWPVKSRFLIRLCGKIDDAAARESFIDCCRFVGSRSWISTTTNASNVTITWRPRG